MRRNNKFLKIITLLNVLGIQSTISISSNSLFIHIPKGIAPNLKKSINNYIFDFIKYGKGVGFNLFQHDASKVISKFLTLYQTNLLIYITYKYNSYTKNYQYSIYGYDLDKICKGLSDYIYYILDDDFKDFKYKNSKKLCDQLFKSIEERKNKYFENNIHFLHSKEAAINRFNLLKHFFINIMNLDVVNVFDDNNSIVCKIAFPNSYAGCNLKTITCEYIEGKTFDKEKYYNPVLNGYGNNVIVAPIIYTNIIYKYNVTSKSLIKVQTHNDCIVDSDELPFDFNEVLFYFLPVVEDDIPLSLGKYPSIDSVNKDLKEVLDKYVNSYDIINL